MQRQVKGRDLGRDAAKGHAAVASGDDQTFLVVRNTNNMEHNWAHPWLGGHTDVGVVAPESGPGEAVISDDPYRPILRPRDNGHGPLQHKHWWEAAVELRLGSPTGTLANKRIKRCTFTLHPTFSPNRVAAVESPFCIRRLGWGEFLLTVTVELVGVGSDTSIVEVEHDLKLDKEVATTVYRVEKTQLPSQSPVLAAVMKMRRPLSCTKVEQTNVFVTEGKSAPVTLLDVFARDLGKAKARLRGRKQADLSLFGHAAPRVPMVSSIAGPGASTTVATTRPATTAAALGEGTDTAAREPPQPPVRKSSICSGDVIRKSSKCGDDYPSWRRDTPGSKAACAGLPPPPSEQAASPTFIVPTAGGVVLKSPLAHAQEMAGSSWTSARPTRDPPRPPATHPLPQAGDDVAVGSILEFSKRSDPPPPIIDDAAGRADSGTASSSAPPTGGVLSPFRKKSTAPDLLCPKDADDPAATHTTAKTLRLGDRAPDTAALPPQAVLRVPVVGNARDAGAAGADVMVSTSNSEASQQDDVLIAVPPEALTEKLSVLGRGGFGVVLKVRTTSQGGLPPLVAVKQLHQTPEMNDDPFWLEANIVASLPVHPNVVRMFGWCNVFGKPSLVFEFCEEGDLNCYLCRVEDPATTIQVLPPKTILDLCTQIAAGMAHVHANRLYHRDLKPNNVLLTRSGMVGPSGLRSVVTDLGLAKNLGAEINLSQSMQGTQVGTYAYMAPETIAKSVFSQGTDVWSYSAVVWQLLTGRPPYRYMGAFNPVAVAFQVGFGSLAPEQLAWPPPFDTIMPLTFAKDHHHRPKFTDILDRLKSDHTFGEINPDLYKAMQITWATSLQEKYGGVLDLAKGSAPIPSGSCPLARGTSPTDERSDDAGSRTPKAGTPASQRRSENADQHLADLTSQVFEILGGWDYSEVLDANGFGCLADFKLCNEDDLVDMGFKKLHARKLLRAAADKVPIPL